MKQYPSIPHLLPKFYGRTVLAFDKLDGSNLRFEWNKKHGWHRFGTRCEVIDEANSTFGGSFQIFKNKYASELEKIFKQDKDFRNIQEFVIFAEWFGPSSKFGQHVEGEVKDLVLFDVNARNRGIIDPRLFVKKFGHLHIPKIVLDGSLTKEFVDEVKRSQGEGVVIKGMVKQQVWMTKVKTDRWLEDLVKYRGEKALEEEFKQ